MLLSAKQPPTQYFRLEKMKEMLSAENSQCLARPELGVSTAAASLASGVAALNFVLSESEDDRKKTGAPAAHAFLNELQESIDAANMQSDVNEDAVEGLVRTFLDQFSGGKAILKDFVKLADTGSRLYAPGMAGAELAALCSDFENWASKVPKKGERSQSFRDFKKPKARLLAAALADARARRSRGHPEARAFGATTPPSVSENEAGSSDSSAALAAKKKKKQKASKANKRGSKAKRTSESPSRERRVKHAGRGKSNSASAKKKAKVSPAAAGIDSDSGQPSRRRLCCC